MGYRYVHLINDIMYFYRLCLVFVYILRVILILKDGG